MESNAKIATLVFVINSFSKELLLGLKTRKVGANKVNCPGGKRQPGETFRQCAVRELKQETGLVASAEDLRKVVEITFVFKKAKGEDHPKKWIVIGYVVEARKCRGTLRVSSELKNLAWKKFSEIPYHQMMPADERIFSKVLRGETGLCHVEFSRDEQSVETFRWTPEKFGGEQ